MMVGGHIITEISWQFLHIKKTLVSVKIALKLSATPFGPRNRGTLTLHWQQQQKQHFAYSADASENRILTKTYENLQHHIYKLKFCRSQMRCMGIERNRNKQKCRCRRLMLMLDERGCHFSFKHLHWLEGIRKSIMQKKRELQLALFSCWADMCMYSRAQVIAWSVSLSPSYFSFQNLL